MSPAPHLTRSSAADLSPYADAVLALYCASCSNAMHIATAPDVDELFAKELAPVIKLDRLFQSADTVSAESYLIQMLRERSVDSYLSLLPTELMRELRVRHTLVTSQLIACTEILRAPTLSVCAAAGGSGKGMDGPRKVHEGMNRDIVTLVHDT